MGFGSPGPLVAWDVQVAEDTKLYPSEVEDHGLPRGGEVHPGPGVGDAGIFQMPLRLLDAGNVCVRDVVVSQGYAVYAGLIQNG